MFVLEICGSALADGLPDKDPFGQYVALVWTRECCGGCAERSGSWQG